MGMGWVRSVDERGDDERRMVSSLYGSRGVERAVQRSML